MHGAVKYFKKCFAVPCREESGIAQVDNNSIFRVALCLEVLEFVLP